MEKKQNKRGLGKGLGALIPSATEEFIMEPKNAPEEAIEKSNLGASYMIKLDQIETSPAQARRGFDDEKIEELAASIKQHGVVQPLVLREQGEGKYQLIAGERRLRAAKVAGLTEVPVVLIEADDKKVAELGLIENLQREDLSPLEEARAFRRMMDEYSYTQDSLGETLGKSRSYIANSLRLLTLNEAEMEYLENGTITPGHGRALLSVKHMDGRVFLLEEIVRKTLSVRQAEDLAKRINEVGADRSEKRKRTTMNLSNPYCREMETKLRQQFGTKVKIKSTPYGGCIEIDYYSEDDLNRILGMVIEEESSLLERE